MINYESILSAFDGKPTLLQWLKMVKKALDESVLKDITVSQDGASAVFTFNFEDGTSISTPAVTLPKGDTGAKGDKGDKGEQGVSVTGVDEVSNEVVGGQTLTTLRFNFSNGTNNEVVVHAENGKNASSGKLYRHYVGLIAKQWDSSSNEQLDYIIGFTVTDTTATAHNRAYWISYFNKLAKYNICTLPEPYIFLYGGGSSVDLLSIFSDNTSLNEPYIYSKGEGFSTNSNYGRSGYYIDNRTDTPQTYAEYVVEL